MGWTFTHKDKGQSVFDFFKKELTIDGEERVIACSVKNMRTAYLAFRKGERVIAIVCLLEYRPHDYYNFGYKDMSEDTGPFYYDCPESILCLLTPALNEHALEWRSKCWQRIHESAKGVKS